MLEFSNLFFESIWHFIGFIVILVLFFEGLSCVIKSFRE